MLTKEEEAKFLAQRHYELEDSVSAIYWIYGPDQIEKVVTEPIKLLEVNANTIPAGVMPLGFGPAPASGLHYSSIIVEVTPDEFQKMQSGSEDLRLPHGWTIGPAIARSGSSRVR